jgi:glycosyltransferase involved in cell wall biosynthesis
VSETPKLSVIAPCFDEELNVPVLVERMLAVFDQLGVAAELVLIDDGSRDGTWGAIQAAMAAHPRVAGARHESNRGIVGGWITGLGVARGEVVCVIDSDLQNRPEDIPLLWRTYEKDSPDLVQAVRHPKRGMHRKVFSRALNHLLNLSFGMHLSDNKSGFVLCRRHVLESIIEDSTGYRYFQSFIGVAAGVRRYRISEVDTVFDARNAGESFLSNFPVTVSLRVLGELVRYRLATLKKRPR